MISEAELLNAIAYGIIVCPAHRTDGKPVPEQLHRSYDEFAACVAAFMIMHLFNRGLAAINEAGDNPENPLIVWEHITEKLTAHRATEFAKRAIRHFGLHLCSSHLELVRTMDSKITEICRFLIWQLLNEPDPGSIQTARNEGRNQAV